MTDTHDAVRAGAELLDIPHCPLTPTPTQARFLLHLGPEALYGGAAGGGKSVALLMAALQFVDVAGYAAIIFRPTLAESSQPSGPLAVAREWLDRSPAVWNGDRHEFRFPSGATLTFGYLGPDADRFRYQGGEYQYVGFDELTLFNEIPYQYLFSRVRRPSNPASALSKVPLRTRATANPGGPGHDWVRRTFIEPHQAHQAGGPEPDAWYFPAQVQDNPHLDVDNYVQSLNRLGPVERARLLNGDWDIRPDGRLFQRDWFPTARRDEVPDDAQLIRYWDLAATPADATKDPDYTAGVLVARDRDGHYWICDIVRKRASPLDIERFVRATAEHDGRHVHIYIEQEPGSAGKAIIDQYRTRVLDGYSTRGDLPSGNKIVRAEPVAARAEAGDLHLVAAPWNNDFLDEAEIFPDGPHDDQIDALAGALNAHTRHREIGNLTGFNPQDLRKESHWTIFDI